MSAAGLGDDGAGDAGGARARPSLGRGRAQVVAINGSADFAGRGHWTRPHGYRAAAHASNPTDDEIAGTWALIVRRDVPRAARQRREAFRAAGARAFEVACACRDAV